MEPESRPHVHRSLDDVVTAIGGHYRFTKECRLPFEGREVLYLCGYAVFDTTCCGSGGCGYVQVKGYLLNWKGETDPGGLPVSRVEPIRDPAAQKRIRDLIRQQETVDQVNFV
jgi:hypothetical protein